MPGWGRELRRLGDLIPYGSCRVKRSDHVSGMSFPADGGHAGWPADRGLAGWRWQRWSGGGVDCLGAWPRRSGVGEVASLVRPGEGRLWGLPRWFAAAAAFADLLGDGPAFGDDLLGLVGGDRVAVVVADRMGGAAVQDRPGPFGEVAGDDAAGLEVGGAAFGHLQVVDPGELGVLAAGGAGGADER